MKIKLRMVKTLLFTALLATVFVAVSCTKKEDFTTDNVQDVINSEKRDEEFGVAPDDIETHIIVTDIKNTGIVDREFCLTEVEVTLNTVTCSYFTNNGNVLYYNWSSTPGGPFYASTASSSCSPKLWIGPGTSYLVVSQYPNGAGATSLEYSKKVGLCPVVISEDPIPVDDAVPE